jgi:hypothetical protein
MINFEGNFQKVFSKEMSLVAEAYEKIILSELNLTSFLSREQTEELLFIQEGIGMLESRIYFVFQLPIISEERPRVYF